MSQSSNENLKFNYLFWGIPPWCVCLLSLSSPSHACKTLPWLSATCLPRDQGVLIFLYCLILATTKTDTFNAKTAEPERWVSETIHRVMSWNHLEFRDGFIPNYTLNCPHSQSEPSVLSFLIIANSGTICNCRARKCKLSIRKKSITGSYYFCEIKYTISVS